MISRFDDSMIQGFKDSRIQGFDDQFIKWEGSEHPAKRDWQIGKSVNR